MATESLVTLLSHATLSSEQLARIEQELKRLESPRSVEQSVGNYDRAFALAHVQEMICRITRQVDAETDLIPAGVRRLLRADRARPDWNAVLRRINSVFDERWPFCQRLRQAGLARGLPRRLRSLVTR